MLVEVDGAVNKNPGDFGVISIHIDGEEFLGYVECSGLTNQIMELLSIIVSLEILIDHCQKFGCKDVVICTDSLTSIQIIRGEKSVKSKHIVFLLHVLNDRMKKLQELGVKVDFKHQHKEVKDIGRNATKLVRSYNRGVSPTSINPLPPHIWEIVDIATTLRSEYKRGDSIEVEVTSRSSN